MKRMMTRLNRTLCVSVTAIVALIAASTAVAAPRYIDAKPLASVINTSIGSVKQSTQTRLPIITWGAEFATIHANGGALKTAPNSLFGKAGLDFQLVREDNFVKQVESYMRGDSPYLRCTLGMCAQALEVLSKDPRTKPVIISQLTWSAGGDALVVKPGINSARDLKGKTVALQAYGPHVDYLTKILSDSGLSMQDIKVKWLPDLTGTDNTPMTALYESNIDAALMIIPDALALTSNGTIGTGAEDSIKGAKIMLSTKTANRIIADIYAVRSDYFQSNRAEVEKLVHALFKAQEQVQGIMKSSGKPRKSLLKAAGKFLLDSETAIADSEGLYADMEFAGYPENVKFFTNPNYPRNMARLSQDIQQQFKSLGLLNGVIALEHANWDYGRLQAGLLNTKASTASRFDSAKVSAVVARKQQQGTLDDGTLFTFEVFFQPNQNSFSTDLYADSFNNVINLASTYGGALITIEGHSDPMGYLKKKKNGESGVVLKRIKQSAKNLSLTRANAVRSKLIEYGDSVKVKLDAGQFAVVGQGISQPNTGICGSDPCAPKTEQEWRSNMRVVFRIIQVEAESSVFSPL